MSVEDAASAEGPVLVTGATGFVGRHTVEAFLAAGVPVHAVCRDEAGTRSLAATLETSSVGSIGPLTNWVGVLEGARAVVHLAARVHVMDDRAGNPLAEYREVNVAGAARLARAAAAAGVKRFILVSSIKVNGESTNGTPFSEISQPAPVDPYGISKLEAEHALHEVAAETGLEVVTLRPPLIYGPGVRANFLRLMQIVARGVPLPLGAVDNRRSLLYVSNLADAIVRCVEAPGVAGETFLISDGEPVSTADLIGEIGRALGRKAPLIAVPLQILELVGTLAGRPPALQRLLGSLELDSSRIRDVLSWSPPFSMREGVQATVDWWRAEGGR